MEGLSRSLTQTDTIADRSPSVYDSSDIETRNDNFKTIKVGSSVKILKNQNLSLFGESNTLRNRLTKSFPEYSEVCEVVKIISQNDGSESLVLMDSRGLEYIITNTPNDVELKS
jgi:hypothetical protein